MLLWGDGMQHSNVEYSRNYNRQERKTLPSIPSQHRPEAVEEAAYYSQDEPAASKLPLSSLHHGLQPTAPLYSLRTRFLGATAISPSSSTTSAP